MKQILIAFSAILAISTARVLITAEPKDSPYLLGKDECTWGPTYWCENLKTAKGCDTVKHCIEQYWEKMEVPEDNDSVCGICKDMVQQARDQLESNQTQQDLKNVFEGSCKLIHIKPIVEECINIVDQFIPELVETLASQMNPSVVCTVAGLCNNVHIDKLLAEHQVLPPKKDDTESVLLKNDELEPDECTKCYTIARYMENKLHHTSRDTMLLQMLHICGQFDSYSDACSSIIMTHFTAIYDHLQNNFNADNICHLSGQCSGKYHKHDDTDVVPKVEITPLSSVGMVEVGDDLPCKLCEQLVGHLRDLLVANTTELEFKNVLLGLCKQTKSFADECKAIVDEYYQQIYEYLTKGLNNNIICQMSGICPAPDKMGPIWPLVPESAAKLGLSIMNDKHQREVEVTIGQEHPKLEAEKMQLPIERLMPYPLLQEESINGKEACALCEYFLHYVQNTLTDPVTEEKVKHIFGKVCKTLPSSVKNECQQFIDTYGDAIVAILVQQIDPSQVCPMIHVCPSQALLDIWEKIPKSFVIEDKHIQDKPSCPLCLLAVTQIYEVIKNNKTEANIEAELDKLCSHLPRSLTEQCTDFVKSYSKELVEMLLTDLTPQEVCAYLQLCDSINPGPKQRYLTQKDGEILTNEIPDYPLHSVQPAEPTGVLDDGVCVICEFAMQYIDKAIGNQKTRDKIEKAVHSVCNHLPGTVAKECNDFVDKYADAMISILSEDVSPKEVCTMLGLCKISIQQIRESIAECALCRAIISEIDKLLGNPRVDEKIEKVVSKVCKYLPADKYEKCTMMVTVYGQSIINMLRNHVDSEKMCSKMSLCSNDDDLAMVLKFTHVTINQRA